jgi:hypothetical protein
MSRDLTDGEITDMALQSRRARLLAESVKKQRTQPPRRLPPAALAIPRKPKPKAPAGGAAADTKDRI